MPLRQSKGKVVALLPLVEAVSVAKSDGRACNTTGDIVSAMIDNMSIEIERRFMKVVPPNFRCAAPHGYAAKSTTDSCGMMPAAWPMSSRRRTASRPSGP